MDGSILFLTAPYEHNIKHVERFCTGLTPKNNAMWIYGLHIRPCEALKVEAKFDVNGPWSNSVPDQVEIILLYKGFFFPFSFLLNNINFWDHRPIWFSSHMSICSIKFYKFVILIRQRNKQNQFSTCSIKSWISLASVSSHSFQQT